MTIHYDILNLYVEIIWTKCS